MHTYNAVWWFNLVDNTVDPIRPQRLDFSPGFLVDTAEPNQYAYHRCTGENGDSAWEG